MNCVIRGLSQKMDFVQNTLQTFLLIELPTGEVVHALVEDTVAERVVAANVATPRVRAPAAGSFDTFIEQPATSSTPAASVMDSLPTVYPQEDEPVPPEQDSDEDEVPSV